MALGAEEVGTGELLLRMCGPRGERARRRALAPAGVVWLRGGGGPAVLRYPPGALVVVGGPPGAGKSTLAARAVDGRRVPVLDPDEVRARDGGEWGDALRRWRGEVEAALVAGSGAVAVTTALREGHRLALTQAAAAADVPAHLVSWTRRRGVPGGAGGAGRRADPGRVVRASAARVARTPTDPRNGPFAGDFASVVIADRAAVDRLRRLALSPSSRG